MNIDKVAGFVIGCLPKRLALGMVRALASSKRPAITSTQQLALSQATELRYGKANRNVAWAWGDGPLVILVHGWNGRAAQLAPLAQKLASQGFRCVAIEVSGHGDSPGARPEWTHFIDDIAALTQSLGQLVHAYVAHSAGGLTTMAARGLKGIAASRYLCICAPSHPFPPIDVLRKRLNPAVRVIDGYRGFIARQFGAGWDELASGSAYAGAGSELLLFYDKADRFVGHKEGDRIARLCPGARLMKTDSYGHMKVLEAPELVEAAGLFLRGDCNNPHSGTIRPAVSGFLDQN